MYKNIYKTKIKNTSCIIEARMTLIQTPGKVLMKVMGKPLLYYLIKRIQKSKFVNKVIIATTKNASDDILKFCKKI